MKGTEEPTLLCDNGNNSILIDEFHRLQTAVIHCSHDVNTSDAPLPVGRRVQQGCLEVSIELGIELAIVTEKDAKRLVCVNATDFKIGAKCMLQEVSMVRSYLKTVRTSDFHQCLVPGLPVNRTRQLPREFQNIAWRMEVGIEEGFSARNFRDMACR